MQSIVTLYSHFGIPLAELATNVTREYRLDAPGVCRFIFQHSDALEESLILPGNYVTVVSEGVQTWLGRISNYREWTGEGPRIQAYQAQQVLEDRWYLEIDPVTNMLLAPPTLQGSVAQIITNMLVIANQYEDTLLRPGVMYGGGPNRQETINQDFLSHLGFVIGRSGYDYDVTPQISGTTGQLTIALNLYQYKGINTSPIFTLEEGLNIELRFDQTLTQNSKIVNRFVGVGDGVNDSNRLAALAVDADSRKKYGLRMYSESFLGVTEIGTLQSNTNTYIANSAKWHDTIRVTCNDPSLFPYLVDGNSVHVVLYSYGFLANGKVGKDVVTRILSAEIEDAAGVCNLVLQDV
jgi:hypothetical protein